MTFVEWPRRIELVGFRYTQAEGHVRAGAVVVRGPLPHDRAKVALGQRDDPVETLAAQRSDEAFAVSIRARRTNRCPNRFDPKRAEADPNLAGDRGHSVCVESSRDVCCGNAADEVLRSRSDEALR